MKRVTNCFILLIIGLFFIGLVTACKEKEDNERDLIVGNWIQSTNKAYILWIISSTGEWKSSVKIPDATGKIVQSRGNAIGTWHIEEGQLIISVVESDVENVWEKNTISYLDIVELTEIQMLLKKESGYTAVWEKTDTQKTATSEGLQSIIYMGPIVTNLNKNRTYDKDRYLCLNMNMILEEMMPGEKLPVIHPRAKEALLIFLSSLVFDNVKNFKDIRKQNKNFAAVLNPYMDSLIKEIKIEHVIVTTDPDKVEEFIIEHTVVSLPSDEDGEENENS